MFPGKRQYTLSTVVCAIALLVLGGASSAQAFPQVLSFQGRLCATDGKPLPDGHYSVQFTIYDAGIGGNSLWQETQDVTQIGGVFAVRLGSVSPFQPDLFLGGDRWLGIKVGSDPEMAERFLFTPSPWAFYAASSGPDNDWTISGANIYRLGGNVGIGLTSPGYTLHVLSAGERALFADAAAHSGTSYGVYGRLASTSGAGVFGQATATTGTANGVAGSTAAAGGSGVYGQNTSPTGDNTGVYGVASSPQAKGVMGYNGSSSGSAIGVLGRTNSSDGYGVRGEAVGASGRSFGVYGDTASTDGIGVYGNASAASGLAHGGWFRTSSTEGWGAVGYATALSGETQGVHGESASPHGVGVYGVATDPSGYTRGVIGVNMSNVGAGVQGVASATSSIAHGVLGQTYGTSGAGVLGYADKSIGVWGVQHSSGNFGYLGTASEGAYGENATAGGAGVLGVTTDSTGSGVRGVNGSYTGHLGYQTAGAMGICHGNIGYLGALGAGVRGEADDLGCVGVMGKAIGECLTAVYGEASGSAAGVEAYSLYSQHRAKLATVQHAGYFEGNVHTTDEYTKAYTTGTANLATPIAYATINATDGAVLAGTPNVTCTWNSGLSRYEITIAGESYNFTTHIAVVTPIGGDYHATTDAVSGKLLVKVYNSAGTATQRWFSVIVYKP